MPLTLEEQFQVATSAIGRGDIDLMEKLLLDPDTITIKDQRTVAQSLGLKGGFLTAAVNLVSDPTVWMAFLMSRTFPVAAWVKGTIPHRFIGSAAEFTGLSAFTRPLEGYFRGTMVPRMLALRQRREAEVMRSGMKMFETFERPNWHTEMPIVSMLLEGQNPASATPELQRVAAELRGTMSQMWGFLKGTKKIEGGFSSRAITTARALDFAPGEAPRFLRDYLPHIPVAGVQSTIEVSGKDALRRLGGGKFAQALQLRGENLADVWSISASDSLASEFTRYQRFIAGVGNQINPRLFLRQRFGIPLETELGRELFITDLNVILPKYVHSAARTYANNAPISEMERRLLSLTTETGAVREATRDPLIVQMINEGIGHLGGRRRRIGIPGTPHFREEVVAGTMNAPMATALDRLVRAVQGTSSDDEILFGNLLSSVGAKLDQVKSGLTGRQINEADAAMKAFERSASYRQKSNGIASYFYTTTLGLNPWSAIQNMFQPVITTMPAIGIGATLRGYRTLGNRLPRYASNVVAEARAMGTGSTGVSRLNHAIERGFHRTFPELAEQGIKIDPRLFDIDETLLSLPRGGAGRLLKNKDAYFQAILQPFTQSEAANRIVSFYGSKEAVRRAIRMGEYPNPAGFAGTQLDELLNFEAGLVTNATQFTPGPGARTIVQGMLPAPFRQFQSFVTRFINFGMESTVRGAMTEHQLQQASILRVLEPGAVGTAARRKLLSLGSGRNMGALSRTYLYGRIAREGLRETLGVDVGKALGISGPLNIANSDQPFAPLPFPPLPSTIYGVMSAALNRDSDRLNPLELPGGIKIPFLPKTLVPGGVATTRLARAMNQFEPDMGGFVDDNNRLMYGGTQGDLLLSMLGVPVDKNRRSRHIMQRAQANRRRVREFRREFAVAAMGSNTEEMDRLRQLYTKRFPDMPGLAVSARDLRRYKENARIPAVLRMLRTMGQSGSFMEREVLEFDPDLIATPDIMSDAAALGVLP